MKKLLLLPFFTFSFSLLTFNSFGQYNKLFDFINDSIHGYGPLGDLYFDGTFLYGMTQEGGANYTSIGGDGIIFKIKNDGTGFFKLLDFNGVNGSYPSCSVISDGTFLYGMANSSGANSDGTIFKIMPDGTGFIKLLDFNGSINGSRPCGSFISDGTYLYGMTNKGGLHGMGTVFKIKPDGSGYVDILDFANDTVHGYWPQFGSLLSDGTFLYGMAGYGGLNDEGVIFKIKPDGTGYSKLYDFGSVYDGGTPFGSLISDGTFLYGMTPYGGTHNMGTLFKIKFDGTGYSKLFDFVGTNGYFPTGSLFSDGTFFYGMTKFGGASDSGIVFKIKSDGTNYVKLLDFTGVTNGGYPYGSLISDGTFLYGMTSSGGLHNLGTIFKINPLGMRVDENTLQYDFNIYPNPSNGKFQIQMDNEKLSIENYQLSIYNVYGEKVYEKLSILHCQLI